MTTNDLTKVSLVIPVRNEVDSIEALILSILRQSYQPDEIIIVDNGSTDKTVEVARQAVSDDSRFIVIESTPASPGKGRNIGIAMAKHQLIGLTDAGIKLDEHWLEELLRSLQTDNTLDIVYGNFSPLVKNLFEKCASISYVPPVFSNSIRGRSVASMLLRKRVWEVVGGFPDMRAAEDLYFMEKAEKLGFKTGTAPKAMVFWQLRPDISSTFKKFVLYSKHNVWAGRAWDWHYGIARQYLILVPFVLLAIFHSFWWVMIFPLWLFARAAKRIASHKFELGASDFFNPLVIAGVCILILTIDAATFIGWLQALLTKNDDNAS